MYLEEKIEQLENKLLLLSERYNKLEEAILPKMEDTLLTTNQTAEKLGITRNHLLEKIRLGQVKAIKGSPDSKYSRYKVRQSEVNRLLSK